MIGSDELAPVEPKVRWQMIVLSVLLVVTALGEVLEPYVKSNRRLLLSAIVKNAWIQKSYTGVWRLLSTSTMSSQWRSLTWIDPKTGLEPVLLLSDTMIPSQRDWLSRIRENQQPKVILCCSLHA